METPLYKEHLKLGAKITEFSGWLMPLYYTNIIDEHITTRTKVTIFDTSHMGEFEIIGKDAFNFLQKVITNDLRKLEQGKALYTVMCNEKGGCVDDLVVYRLANKYMLVVNAANIKKDFEWLLSHKFGDVEIKDISYETAKLDVQGPKAELLLQKLTNTSLSKIKRFYSSYINLANVPCLISRTGYTAEDGFEIYFSRKDAPYLWNKLLDTGKNLGIKPAGLGARDTLRIEACYSLYGHEINETLTPLEAGLSFVVDFNKDFIGKEALLKSDIEKKLVCFEMLTGIPRQDYEIFNKEKIGWVTSGTYSPLFKKGIGLGYVKKGYAEIGKEININIRNHLHKAIIVKRPFYNYRGREK